MNFLSAEWRKLIMVNFVIDPAILMPFLPFGTELDYWQDNCYISLIGFMFLNTKVLGIPIPYHRDFEEVNLRFYVKRKDGDEWKRGVVFIKEIVPRAAITFTANTLYNEKYETMQMDHEWKQNEMNQQISYSWKKNKKWNKIYVHTEPNLVPIEPNSEAEFISEHYWGYVSVNPKKSNEYNVVHPKWDQYRVTDYTIDVDFGSVYGSRFSFLEKLEPSSVFLAEGSEIIVKNKSTLIEENTSYVS